MRSLLSRVERLEEVIGIEDERITFVVCIGSEGCTIHDAKRLRTISNDSEMPFSSFLEYASQQWGINLTKMYWEDTDVMVKDV